jgi:hypothetical protein
MIPYFGAEMIEALLDDWKRPQVRSSKLTVQQAPIKSKREPLGRRQTDQRTNKITLHWLKRSSISRAARVLPMWPRRREVKRSNPRHAEK